MYKKLINTLLFCLLLMKVAIASATITGNDIYPVCEHINDNAKVEDFRSTHDVVSSSMDRGFQIGLCIGAVGTAFQTIRGIGYLWAVDEKFVVCMEKYYRFDELDGRQILDMTLKYLKNHPEHRDFTIGTIMAAMLHDEFPAGVCGATAFADDKKKAISH